MNNKKLIRNPLCDYMIVGGWMKRGDKITMEQVLKDLTVDHLELIGTLRLVKVIAEVKAGQTGAQE